MGTWNPAPYKYQIIMKDYTTYPEAVQNCVRRCRRVARTALVVVTLFWIIFGILTGLNGEGTLGILFKDFYSIFLWIGIFAMWFIAWKWEILGGLLIIAFSIFMAFYLNVFEGDSTEGIMILTPMLMTGFMFFFIGFRIWAALRAESASR